jgi:hypothetical protein
MRAQLVKREMSKLHTWFRKNSRVFATRENSCGKHNTADSR